MMAMGLAGALAADTDPAFARPTTNVDDTKQEALDTPKVADPAFARPTTNVDDTKQEALDTPKEKETGSYMNGDAPYQDLMQRFVRSEYRAERNTTPPPVEYVGGKTKVNDVMAAQGLHLLESGMTIASDIGNSGETTTWAPSIVDVQTGKIIAETDYVQLSADGDQLRVTMINSDGTIDRIVYDEGRVVEERRITN